MPFSRWITRGAALAAAFVLTGCPSLTTVSPPPSADRAASLEQSGDAAGAARVYEELAEQNADASRNTYLLRAAHDWIAARRADEAARVLTGLQAGLNADQQTERGLLGVEVALARGQTQEALRQLAAMPLPANAAQAARYRDLKARAALGAEGAGQLAHGLPESLPHIAL